MATGAYRTSAAQRKENGGRVVLFVNTPRGQASQVDDYRLRLAALKHHIPYTTTTSAALAAVLLRNPDPRHARRRDRLLDFPGVLLGFVVLGGHGTHDLLGQIAAAKGMT